MHFLPMILCTDPKHMSLYEQHSNYLYPLECAADASKSFHNLHHNYDNSTLEATQFVLLYIDF